MPNFTFILEEREMLKDLIDFAYEEDATISRTNGFVNLCFTREDNTIKLIADKINYPIKEIEIW